MVMLATGRHDQLSQVEDATPRITRAENVKMNDDNYSCLGTGVSIKASYWQSMPPVGLLLTAVGLDFINENKNDINKEKQIQQQQQPLKFLNPTKTERFLMPRTLEIAFPSF